MKIRGTLVLLILTIVLFSFVCRYQATGTTKLQRGTISQIKISNQKLKVRRNVEKHFSNDLRLGKHGSAAVPGVNCIDGTDGPILTSETYGRLGNQMYIYATMFASLKNETRKRIGFVNPKMYRSLSKYFKISLPRINQDKYRSINWSLLMIDNDYPTSLSLPKGAPCLKMCCFPQQWELFHSVQQLIRQEFRFHDHIVEDSKRRLSTARRRFFHKNTETATFVGVHVRRTDYVRHAKFLKLHLPGLPFYRGAMTYMNDKYTTTIFIVTSDDIPYCKHEFASLEKDFRIYYAEGTSKRNGGKDLALLANCEHVIYGVGTFGFWAAYLAKGDTIYCSCAKIGSSLRGERKFVLPSWIGISGNGSLTTR